MTALLNIYADFGASHVAQCRDLSSPLPEGEGQGEGEGNVGIRSAFFVTHWPLANHGLILKSSDWLMFSSPSPQPSPLGREGRVLRHGSKLNLLARLSALSTSCFKEARA